MRNSRCAIALVMFPFLILGCVLGTSMSGRKPVAKSSTWVNGYYVAYSTGLMSPEEIPWDGLTHVSVASIRAVDESATDNIHPALDTTFFQGSESRGEALAAKVSSLAKRHDVIPLLHLGGAGTGTHIKNATRPGELDGFAGLLVAAVEKLGYQGLDLNWENDVDLDRFIALAEALRERAPHFILTAPMGVINPNYMSVDPKLVELARHLDQVNVMSYHDCGTLWYGDGWYSGHSSPLMKGGMNPVSIEDTLERYAAAGIDEKKLGMGMAFYGVGFADGITAIGQPVPSYGTIKGGDNAYPLSDLFLSEAYYYALANGRVLWDDVAKCTYMTLPAGREDGFGCRLVSFEDERSIAAKGSFCRDKGYGGAIIWTINEGLVKGGADPDFLFGALDSAFIHP